MVEIYYRHLFLHDLVYDGVVIHVFGRVCYATDERHGASG